MQDTHVHIVDGANVNLVGIFALDRPLHFGTILEGLVAHVNVILECERELAAPEVARVRARKGPVCGKSHWSGRISEVVKAEGLTISVR